MKPAGLILLYSLTAGTLLAEEPAAPSTLSARLKAEARAGLPAYTPPADTSKNTPAGLVAPDPDMLVLPKVTVRKKPAPRIQPNDLLTPGEREKKFAVDYKKSLKGLDYLLNGFSLPIISPSLAARGRAQYVAQQWANLDHVIAVGGKPDDAGNAADLKEAVEDSKRAIDRQNQPAGDK